MLLTMELSNLVFRRCFRRQKSLISLLSRHSFRNEHLLHAEADSVKCPSKLSTLYIPGRYGADMYQIVRPFMQAIDIQRNFEALRRSCQLRGIDLELEYTVNLLRKFESEKENFAKIVEKNEEYKAQLDILKSLEDTLNYESLLREQEVLIEELKSLKEKLLDTEEELLPMIQKLPNIVHPLTPLQSDIEECILPTKSDFAPVSHIEICKKMSLLKFPQNSGLSYYLTGVLSKLEFAIQMYFYNKLKEFNFAPMSCIDFCKSFIVEAVGLDPYSPDQCISIKAKSERGQRLHLVGGASFESFCAYLINMNVSKPTLPIRYFSLGRHYNAENAKTISPDLFSVVQSCNAQCLVLCEHSKSEDEEFEALCNLILSLYNNFKLPFRTVNCAVKNMNSTQNRCKKFELWSPALQGYIPVAYVSGRGDFVSRRLHVTYGVEHTIENFCHVVEGVAVNVPLLIGCIVENFQSPNLTFDFPEELKFLLEFIEE